MISIDIHRTEKEGGCTSFTTIPIRVNVIQPKGTHRKPYFYENFPRTNEIVYARFEVFRPFLCVFMSGFRIFVR